MPTRFAAARRFGWLGLALLTLGLACTNLAAWGQGLMAGLTAPGTPSPAATPRATRTPFRLPPTFTPRPSPTWPAVPPTPSPTPAPSGTPAAAPTPPAARVATATPRISPTPTAYPGGTRWAFEGWCADGATGPCLYSSGFTTREGQRVVRYVFEHIPYPDLLEVRINGADLECLGLADYPGRAYCFGQVPTTLPVTLSVAWRTPQGERVEVYVDPAVVQDLWERERLPLGP